MTLDGIESRAVQERFSEDGYVVVPSLGVAQSEIAAARALLDELFDRFASIPPQFAHDLGGSANRSNPILPEINAVSTLAPALRRTALFRAALGLARQLLGPGAYPLYDHAIYKPPGLAGTTSWHQDSGYDPDRAERLAVWMPFQDTAVADGAMRYVPGSHRAGRRPHLTRTTADGKTVQYLEVDEREVSEAPCPLGGATAHDLHMVHGAGPNLGENVRRAWIIDFTVGSLAARTVEAAKEKVRVRRYAVI
ncbi:phytanoyl-CoA dioxygenase family protein [Blastococcus sp. TF02A-26]|uniref:phytanoyl-CoA dioxygenase family protein n=1 Tax=Blastococcus sp. TF02A-26 TaxID=2250577 RepID=UPI001314F203|nr:phytanoyl-CoA dioxygenase family protein [Blastococcus sp. TF02A-26]